MKKRLFLVRFEFETAGQKYVDFDLITIKFDKFLDEEAGRKAAEETAKRWFKERGTDAVLLSCVAKHTRELIYWPDNKVPVSTPDPLDDGYSADMAIDRIEQLVDETKPYTDRLVLNGWAPSETIQHFQERGHYVNTFEDPDNKDQYTVIKWSMIHTEPSVYIGGCDKWCGMNYCDENGCAERTRKDSSASNFVTKKS